MPEQGNNTSEVELDKLIEELYARKAEAEDVFARHQTALDESGTIDSKIGAPCPGLSHVRRAPWGRSSIAEARTGVPACL
jgi:hypothetical protein